MYVGSLTVIFIVIFVKSSTAESHANETADENGSEVIEMSDEKRLVHNLLRKCNRLGTNGRPIRNASKSLRVSFGLALIQMELDEKKKELATSVWAKYVWKDEYLTWNPGDYGGITKINLEPGKMWKPDIMLYNTANTERAVGEALVLVFPDGTVVWYPPQIFRSVCNIDVTDFPFDKQECHILFGSWTYSVHQLDLHLLNNNSMELTIFEHDYKDSSLWDIISSTAERRIEPPNEDNSFSLLSFKLKLRRKKVFSTFILTLPCVFLACLTLAVFWLPAERPDRTSLSMSIFQTFLLLLLILVSTAPSSASSVPVLGIYYCFNMVIIMLSIFLSSLVVNISRAGQDKRRVPSWLRLMVFNGLARVVCMYQRILRFTKTSKTPSSYGNDGEKDIMLSPKQHESTSSIGNEAPLSPSAHAQSVKSDLKQLMSMVSHGSDKDKEDRELAAEWRYIALVLDRIFFLMYIIFISASIIVLFPKFH